MALNQYETGPIDTQGITNYNQMNPAPQIGDPSPKPKPVKNYNEGSIWADMMKPVDAAGINAVNADMAANPQNYRGLANSQTWHPNATQFGGMSIPGDPYGNMSQNYGPMSYQRSKYGLGYGEDPGADTPWLRFQLEQNRLGAQQSEEKLAKSAASQMQTNMSSLARTGAMNSGAGERMANQSAYNAMIGGQQVGMAKAMQDQALRSADYENRVKRGFYDDKIENANQYANALMNMSPAQREALGGVPGMLQGAFGSAYDLVSAVPQMVGQLGMAPVKSAYNATYS